MSRSAPAEFEVAVVGGGAAGLAAALTAAIAGHRTIVFAPETTFPPGRTAALLGGSIDLLSDLDVWPALVRHAAPITAIRLVDATARLVRAPETTFYASEIGRPAFGFNIPNGDLVDGLRRHAEAFGELTLVSAPVETVSPGEKVGVGRAPPTQASPRGLSWRPTERARSLARPPEFACGAGATRRPRW